MNPIIEKTLHPGERPMAETRGKMEMFVFGGSLFPSQGILVATDQRILYFEKTAHTEMEFVREVQYEDVAQLFVYRDIFHGIVGLVSKQLHLQTEGGEPIRLVAPMHYEEFAAYVRERLPTTAKVKVR